MSNTKSLLLAGILITSTASAAFAQSYIDALRYSYLSPSGTARAMGIGDAVGSIGGDFSSLSINPAGIAVYKSSEVMFTPSLKINSVSGDYLGNSTSTSSTHFNFNNAGIVFTSAPKGRRARRSQWKSFSFGIGVNRLADFNRDYTYSGNNYSSSATQAYAADNNINGTGSDPNNPNPALYGYAGYQAYLTNYDSVNGVFESIVDPSKGVKQLRSVSERGGINEMVISFGGNYMDQLLLGATIGIPIINYSRSSVYSETAIGADSTGFNSYTYNETLNTSGSGINLKLGIIYKASDYFRFGFAIHSPTFYTMHDDYSNVISSDISTVPAGVNPYTANAVSIPLDYNLTTPWRAVLSATGFLGTHGFITVDYEYVDYSSASYSFDPAYQVMQTQVNNDIKTNLQAASNIRVGIEGRITNFFSLRAGYSFMGSPYKTSSGINTASNTISGGFGFRFDRWYLDAAFAHTMYNGVEQPYPSDPSYAAVPIATLGNSFNNASMTVGFKF